MASVHKDPSGRSPFWQASYPDEKGHWRWRSTKTKNRAEAQRIADQLERAAKELRAAKDVGNVEPLMESLIDMMRLIREGKATEVALRQHYDAARKTLGLSPTPNANAKDWLTKWAESKALSKSKATGVRYRQAIRDFLKYLGKRANGSLEEITPQDIEGYRDLQVSDGKSASTANQTVKILRSPFKLALRQGLIATNPTSAVDTIESRPQTRDTFTVEQLRAILSVADTEWRGMIFLGYYGGLRLNDAASLKWGNVDFERSVLSFVPHKTSRRGTSVALPLSPELKEYLLGCPVHGKTDAAPIFPNLSTRSSGGNRGLSRLFLALMEKAGVAGEHHAPKAEGKGRSFNTLTFHSLRHTCISEMANGGVNKELRMKIAGHTSEVTQLYTHFDIETLRPAVDAMSRLLPTGK